MLLPERGEHSPALAGHVLWDCAWSQLLVATAAKPASFSTAVPQPLGSFSAAVHTNKHFECSTAWEPRVGISGWSQPQHRLSILNLGHPCYSQPVASWSLPRQGTALPSPLRYATRLQWWVPPEMCGNVSSHQCPPSNLREPQ